MSNKNLDQVLVNDGEFSNFIERSKANLHPRYCPFQGKEHCNVLSVVDCINIIDGVKEMSHPDFTVCPKYHKSYSEVINQVGGDC